MSEALQKALALHKAGNIFDALPLYEAALQSNAGDLAALFYGGVAAWKESRNELALNRLNTLIDIAPKATAEAHYHRALVHQNMQKLDLARADYDRALAINPRYAPALNNLGNIFRAARDHDAAERNYAAALAENPQLHEARLNRSLNAIQSGALELAHRELKECVRRDPDNALARASLVTLLIDLAAQSEALSLARASSKRLPASGDICNALAQAEEAVGNIEAARAAYAQGIARQPQNLVLVMNAALMAAENADTEDAKTLYSTAAKLNNSAGAQFRLATLLPSIAESEAAIDTARAGMLHSLEMLRAESVQLTDPLSEFGDTPFYLSYHGRSDDQVLLGSLAKSLRHASPLLKFEAPHLNNARKAGKWRVGFCSHFLFDQSVGQSIHALISALPRSVFDVHVLRVPPVFDDALSRKIDDRSTVLRLPVDLFEARNQIAALELDALVFPEIGMDALTYYLAHSRLARVQWTTLGHPCTSGLDTIDSYLSFASLEPTGSERFYSESLIRIPEGSIYPDFPAVARRAPERDRVALGLPRSGALLICPQSLFKLMPQFDATLKEILEQLPDATLLLPASKMTGQTAALQRRFAKNLGTCANQVQFFSRRSRSEFVELIAACDVLLDPFPVGGGITTWDALAAGTPIVTLPSDLMRSRFASSALRELELTHTIAADAKHYADIAVSLATLSETRESFRYQMVERASDVYRDQRAVKYCIEHLIAALERVQ
ncbi:MAG: tetratricopeptide repeat protein [Betaproteobacteria bacterium]|nr:MAG: tetratricopeptide repeat protein [Betaproteobacteria bacterium]